MNPLPSGFAQVKKRSALVLPAVRLDVRETQMQVFVRLELLPKKWQVSPLLLYSLPWHRARTELSRKVSCQSASCRATLFGGSREKCFVFRSRSVDGTEYVTQTTSLHVLLHSQTLSFASFNSARLAPNTRLASRALCILGSHVLAFAVRIPRRFVNRP